MRQTKLAPKVKCTQESGLVQSLLTRTFCVIASEAKQSPALQLEIVSARKTRFAMTLTRLCTSRAQEHVAIDFLHKSAYTRIEKMGEKNSL